LSEKTKQVKKDNNTGKELLTRMPNI